MSHQQEAQVKLNGTAHPIHCAPPSSLGPDQERNGRSRRAGRDWWPQMGGLVVDKLGKLQGLVLVGSIATCPLFYK